MERLVFFAICCFSVLTGYAQNNDTRAKAYYFEAVSAFGSGDYEQVLDYCATVAEILGSSNARIEALRVKTYYEMGNTAQALEALNQFSTYEADETLRSEILPYIVKIEEGEKERLQKEEAAEKERIRIEKETEVRRQALLSKAAFGDGLGLVKENGKAGFINESGDLVIPFQYDDANVFAAGAASINVDGKWGMIDKEGNELIAPQYALLSAFDADGLAHYTKQQDNNDWPWTAGVVDRSGGVIGSIATKIEQRDKGYVFRWVAHWLTEGDSRDYEKAVFLYGKIPSNSAYYVDCQLALGNLYYAGDGVPRDYQKALDHYTRADDKMTAPNQALRERIGDMYMAGSGTTADKEKALAYFKHDDFSSGEVKDLSMKYMLMAADLGHFEAAAAHLAQVKAHLDKDSQRFGEADKLYYVEGYICEQQGNTREAKKLYRRARLFKERTYGKKAQERLKTL